MSAGRKPLTFDMDAGPEPRPADTKPSKEAKTKGESRKQIGARINADTYRQMKLRATMQDKTIGDLFEQAVTEFLANHPA